LTRFLVIDIKDLPTEQLLTITGAIFLLTLAVLVLQIVASKFGGLQEQLATRY
jgi:hypothetical protein